MAIVAIVEFKMDDENQVIQRVMHRFSSVVELEEGWAKLKAKTNTHFYTVNCSKASPPPMGYQQEPGQHWCPYCADPRYFEYNTSFEQDSCNVCGVSEKDHYVQKYNSNYYIKNLYTNKEKRANDNRRRNGQHRQDDPDSSID